MIPETHCVKCGQKGYCDDKTSLCCGCLNIGLLLYAKRRSLNLMERMNRNHKIFLRLSDEWRGANGKARMDS